MSSSYLTDFSAGLATTPPAKNTLDGGPRSFTRGWRDRGAAQRQATEAPLAHGHACELGAWPELLTDLALLGRVWVETERPGLRLAHRRSLAGLRVHRTLGYLNSPTYQDRILLDQCHALHAFDNERGLAIEDRSGQAMVSVERDTGAHPLALRLLLSSLGARGRRLVPAPAQHATPGIAALERHAVGRLQRDCQALEPEPGQPGLGFRDVAELSGRHSLAPRASGQEAARGQGRAIAVDPSLVPCALETLVDQVHPLALSSGSRGWISRAILQFYGHAYVDGQLSLRGDQAWLQLDARAIDSAWVVGDHQGGIDYRSLRLYDEDGRAMAVIASAAAPRDCVTRMDTRSAERAERFRSHARSRHQVHLHPRDCRNEAQLWTTLMNALTS